MAILACERAQHQQMRGMAQNGFRLGMPVSMWWFAGLPFGVSLWELRSDDESDQAQPGCKAGGHGADFLLPFQDHRDDSEDAILRATDAMAAFTQDALNFTATQDSDGSTTAECQGVSTEDWASECSTDSGGPSPWRCIGADASAGPASSLLLDEELKRHEQDPPRAKSCECCGQQTPHELLERRPAEGPRFDGSGQHTPKVLLETRPAEGPRSRELSSLDLFPKFGAPNCSPSGLPFAVPPPRSVQAMA